jgi:hypothetical protein
MQTRAVILALALALLAAGCASTSKVMIGQARPAIAPEQVRVYFSAPPGRYEEIAMLEASSGSFTYGEQNKMDEVIGKLRVAAAGLGANGVLFEGTAQGPGGSNVGIGVGGGRFGGSSHLGGGVGVNISPSRIHARGIAVHVVNPPPMGAQPPAE